MYSSKLLLPALLVPVLSSLSASETTWLSQYYYGSLTCDSSSVLNVVANAMGVCYPSGSSRSFTLSCATAESGGDLSVNCEQYATADCSGLPLVEGDDDDDDFVCPYSYVDLPTGCIAGFKSACETSPQWLSWPGFVSFNSNVTATTTCQVESPITVFGYSGNCATISFPPLSYSQRAVVQNDALIVEQWFTPGCDGTPSVSTTLLVGMNDCHEKGVEEFLIGRGNQQGGGDVTRGATVGSSNDMVYGSSSLKSVPAVDFANDGGDTNGGSDGGAPKSWVIATVAAVGGVALVAGTTVGISKYRAAGTKKKEDNYAIQEGLLVADGRA